MACMQQSRALWSRNEEKMVGAGVGGGGGSGLQLSLKLLLGQLVIVAHRHAFIVFFAYLVLRAGPIPSVLYRKSMAFRVCMS